MACCAVPTRSLPLCNTPSSAAQAAQQEQQALQQDNEWLNEKLDEASSQVHVLRGELETSAALKQRIADLLQRLDSEEAAGRLAF